MFLFRFLTLQRWHGIHIIITFLFKIVAEMVLGRRVTLTEVLALQNVSKLIGTKRIIDDVSFVVDQGQVVGLLGPNGAGKTTIIRMIVGLMKHNTGSIAIMGNLLILLLKQRLPQSERSLRILSFIII